MERSKLKGENNKGQEKDKEDGEIITERKNKEMPNFEITKLCNPKAARRWTTRC